MHTVRQMTLVVEVAIGLSLQGKIHKIMMLDFYHMVLRTSEHWTCHYSSITSILPQQCISSLVYCGLNKHNDVFSHPVQDQQSFCRYRCVGPS